jgi:hypothetical protein
MSALTARPALNGVLGNLITYSLLMVARPGLLMLLPLTSILTLKLSGHNLHTRREGFVYGTDVNDFVALEGGRAT